MKLRYLFGAPVFALLGVLIFAGCNSNRHAAPANANDPVRANDKVLNAGTDGATRISVADAKKSVDSGEALVVDTRDSVTYEVEHIKGSINLPGGGTTAQINQLPKDKLLIAYCS